MPVVESRDITHGQGIAFSIQNIEHYCKSGSVCYTRQLDTYTKCYDCTTFTAPTECFPVQCCDHEDQIVTSGTTIEEVEYAALTDPTGYTISHDIGTVFFTYANSAACYDDTTFTMSHASGNTNVVIDSSNLGYVTIDYSSGAFKEDFTFNAVITGSATTGASATSVVSIHAYSDHLCTSHKVCTPGNAALTTYNSCYNECGTSSPSSFYADIVSTERWSKSCYPKNCCDYI